MTARLAAKVRGRVQGVGFRYFVLREAERLRLVGWVANALDGSLVTEAEGDRPALDAFIESLREGPPGAWVREVEVSWSEPLEREGSFGVRALGHRGD